MMNAQNLLLRDLMLEEVDKVADYYFNDFFPSKNIISSSNQQESHSEILQQIKTPLEKQENHYYAVIDKQSSSLIGFVLLNKLFFGKSCHLHIHLFKENRNSGALAMILGPLNIFNHVRMQFKLKEIFITLPQGEKRWQAAYKLIKKFSSMPLKVSKVEIDQNYIERFGDRNFVCYRCEL